MADQDSSVPPEAVSASPDYESQAGPGPLTETCHEARNMAMLCHLLGIFGFFTPLLIWLIERDKHHFVDDHGRAAMNYQVSLLIYLAALTVTIIGAFLVPLVLLAHVVLSVLGTIKAVRGQPWTYPVAIAFLK